MTIIITKKGGSYFYGIIMCYIEAYLLASFSNLIGLKANNFSDGNVSHENRFFIW